LFDGFLKYESGNVHIGDSLDAVRRVKGAPSGDRAKGDGVVVRIDGNSHSTDERRQALEQTKQRMQSSMDERDSEKKSKGKTADDHEAALPLQKALLNLALGEIGGIFAESSRTRLVWNTSHEKKQAGIHATIEATSGSSLAKRIDQIGHLSNAFAGVPAEGCVAVVDFNLPADPERAESIKSASREARTATRSRTRAVSNKHRRLDAAQWDAIFNLVDEMAEMKQHCGFLRTVADGHGSLTTVGGFVVPDTARVLEILHKFNGRDGVTVDMTMAHEGHVNIHKVTFADLNNDAPGLVDREGAVYVGTGENTVWYGVGEKALDRLKQAIQEAKGEEGKAGVAVSAHAQLLPLAEAWDHASARWKKSNTRARAGRTVHEHETSGDNKEKRTAKTISTISDLDLPKLAVEAYRKGKDNVSLMLTRKGTGLELNGELDEGTLRFVGLVLSRFVKENLED
jgi:hypothetical protein